MMPDQDPKRQVEQAYDHIAWDYFSTRATDAASILGTLIVLASDLPDDAKALDLGCGAGVPSTKFLAARFDTTGVDISEGQLELARRFAPGASYIKSDMTELEFPPASFDAIVAFYSIIHVPREEQPTLVRNIYSWLKQGGWFLATWPLTEWEGTEDDWQGWGSTMWWSHYGKEQNLEMLRHAGFSIESAEEQVNGGGENWLWVLATKGERARKSDDARIELIR